MDAFPSKILMHKLDIFIAILEHKLKQYKPVDDNKPLNPGAWNRQSLLALHLTVTAVHPIKPGLQLESLGNPSFRF